jgi:hypothetical protein
LALGLSNSALAGIEEIKMPAASAAAAISLLDPATIVALLPNAGRTAHDPHAAKRSSRPV